jgi:hypothetical protein
MGIIDGAFYQASKVIFKEKIGKQKWPFVSELI